MMADGSTHSPDGVGSDVDGFDDVIEDNREGLKMNLENNFFIRSSW